jgi:ATP-dependent RNA helicase DHX37/DHR1
VALAAALTVESPFVQIDTSSTGGDKGGGGAKGEEEGVGEGGVDRAELAAAKAQQASARRAHGRLRVAGSDALSALRVLCAFEAATDGAAFAAEHHLHLRVLQEAADLHR